MTDREPDHLFEELRRKLEDYGSQPSADVWAGLEHHLAAQPQAKPRRPRRAMLWLAAACLFLLVSIPAAYRLLPTQPAATASRPHNAPRSVAPTASEPTGLATTTAPQRSAQNAAGLASLKQAATEAGPAAAASAAATTETPSVALTSPQPAGPKPYAATEAPATTAAAAARRQLARTARNAGSIAQSTDDQSSAETATALGQPTRVTPTTGRQPHRRTTGLLAASAGRSAARGRTTPSDGKVRAAARPVNGHTVSISTATTGLTTPATATAGRPTATHAAVTPPAAGAPVAPAATGEVLTKTQPANSASPLNSTADAESVAATGKPAGNEVGQQAAAGAAKSTVNVTSSVGSTPANQSNLVTELLTARPTGLLTTDAPLPAPLSGVALDTARPRLVRPAGRWSLALLAGAGASYRQSGAGADSAGRSLARLERPALSYAAQVQLGYAATPRLRLTAGLGYAEYATRLNAELRKPRVQTIRTTRVQVYNNGTRRDTVILYSLRDSITGYDKVALRRRDTYRYLTVPVQAQFRLATPGRFAYDVLGGAALGLYLGGRTSTGSACACEQTSGRASQFRVASLLLTLGAAAEYEWRPGWHLQLQPVLQYSASSLTPSPRPARRPVALFLQTGLRFDLP